ncbi:MAG: caspase family protein [Rhodobacterales bacterium]|nr:caspase family protein [Rhodobacterales bacterium]
MLFRLTCAFAAFVLTLVPVAGAAADRIALLLGNSDSARDELDLDNPVNDDRVLAEALQRKGFEVIEATDLNAAGMRAALSEFGEQAIGAGMELFFHAGHGVQFDGDNLMVGVDCNGADVALVEGADTPFEGTGTEKPGLVWNSGDVGC